MDIDDPAPTYPFTPGQPAPTTNDQALTHVARQGWAKGAAYFSRLEGSAYDDGVVYFTSTQGGGPDVLDFPDNVTTSPRGTLVVCEDNVNNNYLRGLTRGGRLFDIALNRLVSSTGTPRFDDEDRGLACPRRHGP